jgi:hypothetical protein
MRLISGFRAATMAAVAVAVAVVAASALAASHVSAPSITKLSPTSAKVGAKFTISGKNFTGATSVMLGTMKATFKVVSASSISATVPSKAKTATVTVTTKSGKATSKSKLTIA